MVDEEFIYTDGQEEDSNSCSTSGSELEEDRDSIEEEDELDSAKKSTYRWNITDSQALAAKVAFVLSGSDPKKQNKWIVAAEYWQNKGLLGLDRLSFKKVLYFLCHLYRIIFSWAT